MPSLQTTKSPPASDARHLYKTSFGQCECRWCGERRSTFAPTCPVTLDMRRALRLFARDNGRTWKTKLADEWESGGYGLAADIKGPLQQLRNVIGPTQLHKIPSRLLQD